MPPVLAVNYQCVLLKLGISLWLTSLTCLIEEFSPPHRRQEAGVSCVMPLYYAVCAPIMSWHPIFEAGTDKACANCSCMPLAERAADLARSDGDVVEADLHHILQAFLHLQRDCRALAAMTDTA